MLQSDIYHHKMAISIPKQSVFFQSSSLYIYTEIYKSKIEIGFGSLTFGVFLFFDFQIVLSLNTDQLTLCKKNHVLTSTTTNLCDNVEVTFLCLTHLNPFVFFSLFVGLASWSGLGLWCLTPLSTFFSQIVAVSFIGGGNWIVP